MEVLQAQPEPLLMHCNKLKKHKASQYPRYSCIMRASRLK